MAWHVHAYQRLITMQPTHVFIFPSPTHPFNNSSKLLTLMKTTQRYPLNYLLNQFVVDMLFGLACKDDCNDICDSFLISSVHMYMYVQYIHVQGIEEL